MLLKDAIRNRHSIRKFEKCEIKDEDIQLILEAAMMAPNAKNRRPWNFVVVSNREVLNTFPTLSPYMNMMKEATIAIIICCESAYDEIPHTFESQDCGAAIQNILLKALDLGYGSCWCGIYPDKERVDKFSSLLHLNNVPIAAIALGKTNEVVKTRGFYDENKVTYIK